MFAAFILAVSFISVLVLIKRSASDKNARVLKGHKVALLVTAHPDDECMFFAPTIFGLLKAGIEVQLFCLSRGDYYGDGAKREKEIKNSCAVLGIPPENCDVLNHSKLPDDPSVEWPPQLICDLVAEKLRQTRATLVFSFDADGVSGHSNHKALFQGLILLENSNKARWDVCFYQLETVSILRKYIGFLDVARSFIGPAFCFASTWTEVLCGQRAMFSHWSQLRWFRLLYIVFSRYMFVNTLLPLDYMTDEDI